MRTGSSAGRNLCGVDPKTVISVGSEQHAVNSYLTLVPQLYVPYAAGSGSVLRQPDVAARLDARGGFGPPFVAVPAPTPRCPAPRPAWWQARHGRPCLLYTSDAADDLLCVG